jgi:transposase
MSKKLPSHTENGRFSAKRKSAAVLRLLRGEDLDLLSREYKVTAAKLSSWRDAFLARGQAGLQPSSGDGREEQIEKLQAKVGELTMANDLLEHKIERLEQNLPLPAPRSKS